MAVIELRVLRGSHSFRRDGRTVTARKGETFEGDDKLLIAFGDKLQRVEKEQPVAKKRRGRKAKAKANEPVSTHGESDSDRSAGDCDNLPDGCAD